VCGILLLAGAVHDRDVGAPAGEGDRRPPPMPESPPVMSHGGLEAARAAVARLAEVGHGCHAALHGGSS
jgi:hypothetical protein